jgi:hypothetical protein
MEQQLHGPFPGHQHCEHLLTRDNPSPCSPCSHCTGPSPCFLVQSVMRGGKTMDNGRTAYGGCIRHQLPLLCPQGALGRMLCHRFTVQGERFPNLETQPDLWYKRALWVGNDPEENITYASQRNVLLKAFEECGISSSKMTHAFRILGARTMDQRGVPVEVGANRA